MHYEKTGWTACDRGPFNALLNIYGKNTIKLDTLTLVTYIFALIQNSIAQI